MTETTRQGNGHLASPSPGGEGRGEGERNLIPKLSRPRLLNLRLLAPEALRSLLDQLVSAAARDHHIVLNPTHVMLRGDQITGYLSLNGLPQVHCWFDTQSGHVFDSLKMIEAGEVAFAEHGIADYTVACAEESPFTPHLERMGYTKLGATVLWRKAR